MRFRNQGSKPPADFSTSYRAKMLKFMATHGLYRRASFRRFRTNLLVQLLVMQVVRVFLPIARARRMFEDLYLLFLAN